MKKYKVSYMIKRIFILITYIFTLSSLYSIEYTMEIGAEAKVLPITADFYNKFSLTGIDATIWGTFICNNKFGLLWQIEDNYISQTTYDTGTLASGASNIFYAGIGFIFLPVKKWRFEFKQNFLWNQSAFDFKENGVFTETQFGTSTNLNVFFTPSLVFPYLHLSLHNNFRFYPITRNKNFQWEYEGTVRFTANPYIKNIGIFTEVGFSYLNCDTSAIKYDSFTLMWNVGVNFSYKWEKTNSQKHKTQAKMFEISSSKILAIPQVKTIKRPELYFDFYNAKLGQNVRIEGIYFDEKNRLTRDSCIKLEALVLYLKDYPATTIVIVSYVENSVKTDEEIMAISVARTNSIKDFLIKNEISETQIKRSPSAIIFNPELSKIPHIEIKILKK